LRVVSGRLQVLVIGMHLLVAMVVVAAVTLLTATEKPITPLVAGIFGTVLGLAGGAGAAAAALGTALNGKSAVSPELLANQQQIIREAQSLIAGQQPISNAARTQAAVSTEPPLAGTSS
jgi:hypothetical protein